MSFARRLIARPHRPRLGGRRSRVAFVVDWLEDPYQSTMVSGASAAATERDVHLFALRFEFRDGRVAKPAGI